MDWDGDNLFKGLVGGTFYFTNVENNIHFFYSYFGGEPRSTKKKENVDKEIIVNK